MLKSQSWNLAFFVPNMASKYRLKFVSSIQAILTIYTMSTLYLIRLEQRILDISLNSKSKENRRNEIKNAKIYKTSP